MTPAQERMGLFCSGCVFFSPDPNPGQRRGQCRRHAPSLDKTDQGHLRSVWPLVQDSAFCGEHSSLEELELEAGDIRQPAA